MAKSVMIWAALLILGVLPIILASQSPLLAWRDPVYIAAGFAGIVAMVLVLVQPLLARNVLPGRGAITGRRVHRFVGVALLVCVLAHVAGLWITSPPDVIDVLLFRSPTPFAIWGALAMWGVILTAGLAFNRRKLRPRLWRGLHMICAVVIVIGTVIHAVQIEGTMEPQSKWALAVAVIAVNAWAIWSVLKPRRT